MILLNDFKAEYLALKHEYDQAALRVFDSGWYILGKECESFERQIEEFVGSKYAIGVGNGFDALQLILRALKIGDGDEVITTPNTAFATALAIYAVGATPVFVDINPSSYGLNSSLIEAAITPKTKAILPVHIYGNMKGIEAIEAIADKTGIPMIEDACQAFGASKDGCYSGAIGIAGAYSFYPTKNLGAAGDGGMVVTADSQIAEEIRSMRNYGQTKRYYHDVVGINSRLDELQAAILSFKLRHLPSFNKRRMEIATRYDEEINSPLFHKPELILDGSHCYHLYVLRTQKREQTMNYLDSKGIKSLIHYPVPCHKQKAYPVAPYELPIAERFAQEYFSIPIHPFMSDDDVTVVCQSLNNFK